MQTQNTTDLRPVEVKDDQALLIQSKTLVEMAASFQIKDELSLQQGIRIEKELKEFLDGPATYHDEEIDMANKLHKHLCGKRNILRDPVDLVRKGLKNRMAKWIDDERQKREEEQRKADAEAKRIEADKQAKIQAKIDEENRKIEEAKREEERIQREKDAQIKASKDKAERERLEREEADRRAKQAIIDDENRAKAEAKKEVLVEKKENIYVQPKLVAAAPTHKGISIEYDYEPIIENKAMVPEAYKFIDLALLKKTQKLHNGVLQIPGVTFKKVPKAASRGKAA